ncbi:hypothetical protein TEQG_08069 [Trichophyton equinum CBS 127.97]|uniref:Uncharacterized protein n=1 Tax=Trichophyton equinum (strain ATCC MYA-4606 / CBS 127.97) TaxID=559882 RepID=F2Q4H0_TRIEC|nr:hypothetical protein TEQG_08069 [Trichophyton equinum CBS 127.97]
MDPKSLLCFLNPPAEVQQIKPREIRLLPSLYAGGEPTLALPRACFCLLANSFADTLIRALSYHHVVEFEPRM